MINIGKILKRSAQILWDYRILWVFGLLFALTSGGGGGVGRGNTSFRLPDSHIPPMQQWDVRTMPPALRTLVEWFEKDVLPLIEHPEAHVSTLIWIGVAVLSFVLLIGILQAIVRYVSETAIMRMVDEYEQSGVKVGFRQGWRLGWNRRAFRLWLIDLIVVLPVVLAVALFIGGSIVLLIAAINRWPNEAPALVIVAFTGWIFLFMFVVMLIGVFIDLLRQFFSRMAALEGMSTLASLRNGWQMVGRHWKDALLVGLIMLGIRIGFSIFGFIAFFLLIPLYLLLLLPAALIAAIPGALAFGIASLFTTAPLNWLIGILLALPVFFTVLFAPLFFLSALYLVYESNVWTLTYRELKLLETTAPVPASANATFGQ